MLKAYKYRIYPNNEQKIQIAKTFGCCRFVYNQTLAYRKEVYEKEKKSVSKTDCNNYCNRQLKKEYEWLKEVDKFALTNAIYNMDAAYQKFFKEHAGYPKFKSKHDNHKSYTTNFTNGNITVDFGCNRVKLPKLKGIKAKLHRNFIGQIKSATISQVPSGKYYVSILVETEHVELPHINQNTGIDLGIKELCITSAGKKYENPKIIRKYEKKLVKLQRQLAHKEKRSQNYCKTKKKIALCHEKITNTRKDYLHKMSHEIISENQVIVSEDLQIKNMVKNHRLAKSISDVSWYELTRQLEYKAKWNGRKYVKIDTFYASSQLCSVCGYQNTETKNLSVREWTCPVCGTNHDRDINAAKHYTGRGITLMDLIQEGNIGLMHAAEKYDYTKENRFSTYASWWIKEAMQRAIDQQSREIRVPVHVAENMKKVQKISKDLQQKFGREATPEEIAAEMKDKSPEFVKEILSYLQNPVSLETPVGEDGENNLGDMVEDKDATTPEDAMNQLVQKEEVQELLESLNDRERQVIRLRFGLEDGKTHTLEEIGDELNVTRERVRQIEARAMEKLRSKATKL